MSEGQHYLLEVREGLKMDCHLTDLTRVNEVLEAWRQIYGPTRLMHTSDGGKTYDVVADYDQDVR